MVLLYFKYTYRVSFAFITFAALLVNPTIPRALDSSSCLINSSELYKGLTVVATAPMAMVPKIATAYSGKLGLYIAKTSPFLNPSLSNADPKRWILSSKSLKPHMKAIFNLYIYGRRKTLAFHLTKKHHSQCSFAFPVWSARFLKAPTTLPQRWKEFLWKKNIHSYIHYIKIHFRWLRHQKSV